MILNADSSNSVDLLYRCLTKLKPMEMNVLSMTYGIGCRAVPQHILAQLVGKSTVTLRSIRTKALANLKFHLKITAMLES